MTDKAYLKWALEVCNQEYEGNMTAFNTEVVSWLG
jgi:hypothetical protein